MSDDPVTRLREIERAIQEQREFPGEAKDLEDFVSHCAWLVEQVHLLRETVRAIDQLRELASASTSARPVSETGTTQQTLADIERRGFRGASAASNPLETTADAMLGERELSAAEVERIAQALLRGASEARERQELPPRVPGAVAPTVTEPADEVEQAARALAKAIERVGDWDHRTETGAALERLYAAITAKRAGAPALTDAELKRGLSFFERSGVSTTGSFPSFLRRVMENLLEGRTLPTGSASKDRGAKGWTTHTEKGANGLLSVVDERGQFLACDIPASFAEAIVNAHNAASGRASGGPADG